MVSEETLPAEWIRRAEYHRALKADKDARLEDYTDHLEIKPVRLVYRKASLQKYRAAMRHLVKEAIAEAIAKRDMAKIRLRPIERLHKTDPKTRPRKTKHSPMPFAFGEPEEVASWWDAYKEMREQQIGALRALARPLGKTVFWPEGSHRPPTIRAVERYPGTAFAASFLASSSATARIVGGR